MTRTEQSNYSVNTMSQIIKDDDNYVVMIMVVTINWIKAKILPSIFRKGKNLNYVKVYLIVKANTLTLFYKIKFKCL